MGVIAISGEAASGKTTVARLLAWKLGYRAVSIGELFRKVAQERGVSLIELHRLAESDHSIDRMVDSYALGEAKMGNVVIEGHLAAWVLKDVADIKVYLKADENIRAARLANRDGRGISDAMSEIRDREDSNRKRYKDIYGFDVRDLSIFDLVIDTTRIDPPNVLGVILEYVRQLIPSPALGEDYSSNFKREGTR